MNANTNPSAHLMQVHIYEDTLDVINGWENWSLKDVIEVLKNMSKTEYSLTGAEVGNIVFYKLLETAEDPNIPFEVIKKTVHMALNSPSVWDVTMFYMLFMRSDSKTNKSCAIFLKNLLSMGK